MKKEIVYLALICLTVWVPERVCGQSAHELRRGGDKKYSQGGYTEAEEKYRKALEKDPDVKAYFNLGNSLYQQQRFEEALEQYNKALAHSDDPAIQSQAYYNQGNSYFSLQKLAESVEAYKHALRKNPDDPDAKRNLMIAKQLLRQQQQQQQEQQQQQQNQQQEPPKDQESGEQQKQDQNREEQNSEREEQQDSTPEPSPQNDSLSVDSLMQREITREELMKLLKSIEEEDKQIQQKLRRGSGNKKKPDKDW